MTMTFRVEGFINMHVGCYNDGRCIKNDSYADDWYPTVIGYLK